jgi:N-acetylmuramoyl-L-alanine amidase
MNFFKYFSSLFLFLLPVAFEAEEDYNPIKNQKITTIVLDAGHGGKDSGSLGANSKEKDITLIITKKVGAYLKEQMPDVKVIYTREKDEFVPLVRRIELANKKNADIFISIHCNSVPPKRSEIQGTETYVMGLHTAEENLQVAKRENSVILLEDDYKKNYGGYDPNSTEAHIIFSMYQNAFLSQSILLAEKMENQFKNRAKRNSRGVKQAGFVVLKAASMPSVLVETGFLSNKSEEEFLKSEKGQSYLASAIYRAIKDYKEIIENGTAKHNYRDEVQETITAETTKKQSDSKIKIVFKVQLASSPVKLNTTEQLWRKVTDLEIIQSDKNYKYLSGNFKNLNEATEKQNFWRKNGFKDAFVVAYNHNERIDVSKALEILGK